jgi:hydroxymethylpyrimidine pyrophosphatase-like HAD family hydrolase
VSTLIACDLDQTLIYSSRALRLPGADTDAPTMVSVEVIEGRPMSFMTLAATQALTKLSAEHPFVPCTTRTVEQFRRVRVPLTRHSEFDFAVASNGGNLLVNGRPDPDWRRGLDQRLADTASPLAEVVSELRLRASGDWVLKRRSADDLFCYLVVDLGRIPEHFLSDWHGWCEQHGWLLSVQGRKVYSTPVGLRKSAAIAEVAARVGADRLIAAGDGLLDAELLDLADAGIRPSHGELEELGWTRPHVETTTQVGILAGEEIIGWFGRRADY